jgi:hypothetical protein
MTLGLEFTPEQRAQRAAQADALRDYQATTLGQAKPLDPQEVARETAELIKDVTSMVRRYVLMPDDHALSAVGLWVLHTYAIEAADTTPYLFVTSGEKRSGKSRLLDILGALAFRARRSGSITAAAIYQLVDQAAPTLLIDEVDTIFGRGQSPAQEALRGIVNMGFQRGTPVTRGTKDGEFREFDTFCPKALAGIDNGTMEDTVRDRCIRIQMVRKLREEPVARMRHRVVAQEAADLRARMKSWASKVGQKGQILDAYDPESLYTIDDRAEDAWTPLWAIADLAGSDHLAAARRAAEHLCGVEDDDLTSDPHKLLLALRQLFAEGRLSDRAFTSEIVWETNSLGEFDFQGWHRGAGIKPADISRLLGAYGIKPRSIRRGTRTAKGYWREDLEETFSRNLSHSAVTTSHPSADGHLRDSGGVTPAARVPDAKSPDRPPAQGCDGVTDEPTRERARSANVGTSAGGAS